MTPQIAGQLGLQAGTQGVVVTAVDPNADSARKGITRGTVIVGANGRAVAGVDQLEAIVRAAKAEGREAVLLRVRARGAPELSVAVRLR